LVAGTDIGITYSTTDDYDGDGYADNFDNCPFVFNKDQTDTDGDGVGNACDNCANAANSDQSDINGNGVGDVCDPDMDGDGINDKGTANFKDSSGALVFDNCPKVPNPDQGVLTPGSSVGTLCDPAYLNVDCSAVQAGGGTNAACTADTDKDGIVDKVDNCIAVWNPDQSDINKNGKGDACDADMDGDLKANNVDNCPGMYNPGLINGMPAVNGIQNDGDKNGYGDNWDGSGNIVSSYSNSPDPFGNPSNGVQLCNPTGFCFVAANNKSAACLDPKGVFQVTATPNAQIPVGDPIYLGFLANRQNTSIKYSWKVTSAPAGAHTVVSNPVGSVSQSDGWDYTKYLNTRSTFTPQHPGSYVVTLAADLASADSTFPSAVHAESTVALEVTGAAKNGCQQSDATAMALIASLGVLGFGMIRRRRQ